MYGEDFELMQRNRENQKELISRINR